MSQHAAASRSKLLFIDDADISSMEGVHRRIHPGLKHEDNPVVTSDNDWEAATILIGTVLREGDRYRMWYQSPATAPGANGFDSFVRYLLLYAESDDGLTWTKPALGSHPDPSNSRNNNIAFVRPCLSVDVNASVLHAPQLADGHAYTMMTYGAGYHAPYDGYIQAFSGDGITWAEGSKIPVIPGFGDGGWFSYDEVDGTARGSVSWDKAPGLVLTRSEDGREWTLPWPAIVPDEEDRAWEEDDPVNRTAFPGLPIFRYGPVLLGFLQVRRGRETPQGFDGVTDIQLVCSRDGAEWQRVGDRQPVLLPGEEGSWDSGLVWMGSSLVTDGDRSLVFYSGCEKRVGAMSRITWPKSIGMTWWPKDRFAGLTGDGVIVTRPTPGGRELHLNADASRGSVTAQLLNASGDAVDGFDSERCVALENEDALDHQLRWRDGVSAPEGDMAIRLMVRDAEVFSVWWE